MNSRPDAERKYLLVRNYFYPQYNQEIPSGVEFIWNSKQRLYVTQDKDEYGYPVVSLPKNIVEDNLRWFRPI